MPSFHYGARAFSNLNICIAVVKENAESEKTKKSQLPKVVCPKM